SGLDDIDAGTVLVGGEDIQAMSDARRTRHRAQAMGFIFQAFNLIPVFTATENVELPLLLAGKPAREARAAAQETLERVGLGHRLNQRPNELSGGEQQRVTVARALAGRPEIVWADEPTGNLDTETAGQVMDLLRETALGLLGAMPGPAIITSSYVVGDTLRSSIRNIAYTQLGPIDETVTANGSASGSQVAAAVAKKPPAGTDGTLSILTVSA